MSSSIVQLSQVCKEFSRPDGSRLHALQNISFEISKGEVVAIVGPSGSGKSTCLRTLNGLERIDSGKIVLCGIDLSQVRSKEHLARRKTAMIFQHFELFPHLTVLENVTLAPRITQHVARKDAIDLASRLLDEVGMSQFAHQFPGRLSGGQKQRAAIARALAVRPEVLLCDEPTSALDPELVGEITAVLAKIAAQGMTMVMVTHEMNFARSISNRCIFMQQGQLLLDQRTNDFFDPSKFKPEEAEQKARLNTFLGRLSV